MSEKPMLWSREMGVGKIRRWLGLHVHEWEHDQTVTLGGYSYDDGPIRVIIGKRIVHFRRCQTCDAVRLYYPDSPFRTAYINFIQAVMGDA